MPLRRLAHTEIASIRNHAVIATPLPARDADAEGRAFVTSEGAIAGTIFGAPGDLAST